MVPGLSIPAIPSRWFLARISLFWLGLSFMWGTLNIQVLPAVVPDLVGSEIQGTAIGAIVFFGLIIAVVVQPVAGAISDRARYRVGRRRPFMAVGVLVSIPFLIVIGVAPAYWVLLLAVVGLQIGANIAHGPYQGVIPDLVPRNARGRASGFFGMANLVGTLLGAAVASVFLASGHVLPAILMVVAVLLATSLASWVFVAEPTPKAGEPFTGVRSEARRRIRELRQRPAFVWLMLSRLLFFMGLQAMDNFLQLFIDKGLHEPDPELKTTGVLGAVLVMAVLSSIPAGWAADRFGRLRLIATATFLGFVAAVLMIFAQSFVQTMAFASLLGIGLGLFTAADWAAAIDLVPDLRAAGLYMGLTNVATAGGDALATLSAGIALDVFNRLEPGLGYRATFAMMGLYFLLSLTVLLVVRSRVYRVEQSGVLLPNVGPPVRDSHD